MRGWLGVLCCVLWWAGCVSAPWNQVGETRPVHTQQGRLRGVLLDPLYTSAVSRVAAFLGVPYAAPPVGPFRFMPPVSPPAWGNVTRMATKFAPVCPQVPPRLDAESKRLAPGRLAHLKRLLPHLQNQSEDCLYLNIYAPAQDLPGPPRLAVMVFIHGESFSWNSGNPYDGSILAGYANVVVVTLNYRLGILGFLKPGVDSHTISNFGLLDQIAALQWVHDNIATFGGDPTSVTLVGHHTGAVSVNYLMLSPVVQVDNGLFQRAVLMSGSGLSEWGRGWGGPEAAVQVAEALNCPRAGHQLLTCLQKKRVSDLLAVRLPRPLGPIVDGHVVPNHPADLMANYTDLFTRYDLLCGVVESETYHLLDAQSLAVGLLESKRDELLKQYFRDTFQLHPGVAQAKATMFYGRLGGGRSAGEKARDDTLALLGDAQVVAPLVQTAIYHSRAPGSHANTFMYVFGHRSEFTEYHHSEKSVFGEDVPYLLGIPLAGPRFHYDSHYNSQEKLLSEVIMTLWTNFAKTGDPNKPFKHNYLTLTSREWSQYQIIWPQFEPQHQSYFYIENPLRVGHKYKSQFMKFWNDDLPHYLLSPTNFDRDRSFSAISNMDFIPESRDYPPPWHETGGRRQSKPVYGTVRQYSTPRENRYYPQFAGEDNRDKKEPPPKEQISSASSFTMSLIIIVGMCFLLINIIAFGYICYQKKRMNNRIDFASKYRSGSSPSLPDLVDPYATTETEKTEVKSILKPGSSFELLRAPKKWPIYRQTNTATVDPHRKVTEWMAQEMAKSTPNLIEKVRDKDSDKGSAATTSKIHRKIKKVSVAVDATPGARSASVLKQTPIELTKSLDSLTRRKLERAETVDEDREANDSKDINVTSRDEKDERPRTPEEALDNIKRRNFPKVLPDFPEGDEGGLRLEKRMSVPQYKKVPPPPPPRTSTLGRRPPNRNSVANPSPNYANVMVPTKPKVIIKPSLGEPKDKPPGVHVRHPEDPPDPPADVPPPPASSTTQSPARPPGGVGSPVKIPPVKKTNSDFVFPDADTKAETKEPIIKEAAV